MLARMIHLGASAFVALCLASSVVLGAEPVIVNGAQPENARANRGSALPARIDESALRYYASLKKVARVEAEIRRLKRIDPQWQPPTDLWATRPGSSDEGPLWELYALDKWDELRAAMDARRARDSNWVASTDLAQKISRKQARDKVAAGKRAGRWDDVATAADEGRLGEDVGDVALLWDIADAYVRTKRSTDAARVLTSILAARSDPKERIATIQKAIASLPMADVERLIAMGGTDASGASEFATIANDVTRARIIALLHDEPANDMSATELARFTDYARAESDANQAGLVAWYDLKRGHLREALEWFKVAIAKGGDATIAHGLAHTLLRLGQPREAEEVAYAWREPSTANAILFIDILADQLTQAAPAPVEAKRLAHYAAVTMQTASGEGAQALGWYAYNSCQFDVAADWFRRSVAWLPKETTAFGYALTLRRLKRQQEFVEIVNRYDGLFPKVLTLLFPDTKQPSSSPCDVADAAKIVPAAAKPSEFLDLRSEQNPSALVRVNNDGRPSTPRIAKAAIPTPLGISAHVSDDVPLVRRTEFPVAVSPENPLRFFSTDRGGLRAATAGEWRDGTAATTVTSARRVPGVGPMPYERFGLTLRQGWNGIDRPSFVPLEAQVASGTLWHAERIAAKEVASAAPSQIRTNSPAVPDATSAASSRFHP